MTQAITIIRRAFLLLGVIDANQSPEAAQTADALRALNDMLADWSASQLLVTPSSNQQSYAFVSTVNSLTVGPTGVKVTTRPSRISNPYLRVGTADYAIELITEADYYAIAYKTIPGSYCQYLWYDPTATDGTMYFYPAGNSGQTLYWDSIVPLQVFATANDDITLPPNYLRALAFNLAIDIAPEYGVNPSVTVLRIAASSKRGIKNSNVAIPGMLTEATYLAHDRPRINIVSGQ